MDEDSAVREREKNDRPPSYSDGHASVQLSTRLSRSLLLVEGSACCCCCSGLEHHAETQEKRYFAPK